MTTQATRNQAIITNKVKLTSCPCTAVVVETVDGLTLDAEVLEGRPDVGMVALNPETGRTLVLDESWLKAVNLWLESGRVTLHHPHECSGVAGGVQTADRGRGDGGADAA